MDTSFVEKTGRHMHCLFCERSIHLLPSRGFYSLLFIPETAKVSQSLVGSGPDFAKFWLFRVEIHGFIFLLGILRRKFFFFFFFLRCTVLQSLANILQKFRLVGEFSRFSAWKPLVFEV